MRVLASILVAALLSVGPINLLAVLLRRHFWSLLASIFAAQPADVTIRDVD